MPKIETETTYICEKCGARYSDINNAKNCEKEHQDIEDIVHCRYDSWEKDSTYPKSIVIKFTDGKQVKYYRDN